MALFFVYVFSGGQSERLSVSYMRGQVAQYQKDEKMSKSWRDSKKVWTNGKGSDRRKELSRKEEEQARREIKRIARRTGERMETFMD